MYFFLRAVHPGVRGDKSMGRQVSLIKAGSCVPAQKKILELSDNRYSPLVGAYPTRMAQSPRGMAAHGVRNMHRSLSGAQVGAQHSDFGLVDFTPIHEHKPIQHGVSHKRKAHVGSKRVTSNIKPFCHVVELQYLNTSIPPLQVKLPSRNVLNFLFLQFKYMHCPYMY